MLSNTTSNAGMSFASSLECDPIILCLSGELDIKNASDVQDAIQAVAHESSCLILDLSGLRFCDCAAVSMFLKLAEQRAQAGGSLRLAAPTGPVRRVLEALNIDKAVAIEPTATHAPSGRVQLGSDP
jgi:stage II sporulation protein AA (anti-sigma F factor antagonist)